MLLLIKSTVDYIININNKEKKLFRLGAEHDGTRNTTAEKCSVKHGYIMGAQSGMNMFYYSKCSVEAIQNHEQCVSFQILHNYNNSLLR